MKIKILVQNSPQGDTPMAAECLLTERHLLFTITMLNLSIFSGVRRVGILPRVCFLKPKHFPEGSVPIIFLCYHREHGHDEEC
jgi:hypothetical protein